MLKSFCIKTNNKNVLEYLQSEFKNCDLSELYLSINNFKNYRNIILHYKGEHKNSFYALIAKVLQTTVNLFYEQHLIKNFLLSNYFYFSEIERKEILEICIEMLEESVQEKTYMNNLIYDAFFKYIEKSKYLILDGFINFRLAKYMQFLDEFVDLAVDKFVVEREYNEFIELLKAYIASQESQTTEVHLICHDDESILLDERKHLIDTSSDIFDGKYLSDISFSSNDYALNALLSLLPQKIYIHLIDNNDNEFINTLQQIFENRVYICFNCPICDLYKNQKKQVSKECTSKKADINY